VYRLLRHSLEGCSQAVNVISIHQSSYLMLLIERSTTKPCGFISVSFRLEIMLILMQDRCTICGERTISSENILDALDRTPRWLGSYLISFRSVQGRCTVCAKCTIGLEIVLILTQERCSICAEHRTGSEIILEVVDVTTRWLGSCGISFRSMWRKC
jgi:hypothetical protein